MSPESAFAEATQEQHHLHQLRMLMRLRRARIEQEAREAKEAEMVQAEVADRQWRASIIAVLESQGVPYLRQWMTSCDPQETWSRHYSTEARRVYFSVPGFRDLYLLLVRGQNGWVTPFEFSQSRGSTWFVMDGNGHDDIIDALLEAEQPKE